jgi:hypothetical protein
VNTSHERVRKKDHETPAPRRDNPIGWPKVRRTGLAKC